MAEKSDVSAEKENVESPAATKKAAPIPGDFSYTTTPGKLKSALQAMTVADRPEHVDKDFISAYLGVSGGSAAPIPPILRKIGFLGNDNRPTDRWARFQSESSRAAAALEGLRQGFPEIFKRHTYAHTLDEGKIKDILVEITGRTKGDKVLGQIYGTFEALRSFIPPGFQGGGEAKEKPSEDDTSKGDNASGAGAEEEKSARAFGLSYHINIVLPETKDVAVFNAIFQSLKQNLLR